MRELRFQCRGRALRALPLCATILLAASGALAQAPAATASPEDIAAARSLGTEGTRLADAGDCKNAIPKLESAEKLYHAPTTLDRLGECQVAVGLLVAGTESLNRVVREPLAPNAPAAFVAAQKRAQKAFAAAEPRIGNVKIHVDGAPADKLTITVDGAAVPSALLDADRPTDPGTHAVSVSAPGYKTATQSVDVKEGAESPVAITLAVDPSAAVAAVPPPAPVTPETAPAGATAQVSATAGGGHGPAIAAFAVGGAGLLVGTIFGVLALSSKSTLDSKCTNKTCPSSEQSDIDSLSTKATISTIGFGVGLVGVGVGAVLLAVQHPEKTGSARPSTPTKPQWSPWIGLGAAGVGGTFQ
ncbi:MAG TPA: hypothetical protein VHV30_17540 [Polyangiaceae bacterium]|jgi:hypothetical protein|nr:hypothetical protein [Polyangiaceae bacterium]